MWSRTCSLGDPTPQRLCAWLLSTYLKESEEQKEMLEAPDSLSLPTSSLPPAMAIDILPDLIVASRNGLRAMNLWSAAWANRKLLRTDS